MSPSRTSYSKRNSSGSTLDSGTKDHSPQKPYVSSKLNSIQDFSTDSSWKTTDSELETELASRYHDKHRTRKFRKKCSHWSGLGLRGQRFQEIPKIPKL